VHWQTNRFAIDLTQPRVMGIVNVTPDSFFDGGLHADTAAALAHCDALLAEGAHILDIGGESTRPGASAPGLEEELARVLPVLRHAVALGVPVSVDTSRPEVMRAALDLGVDIVNDVRALKRPGALDCMAGHPRVGMCLMHMRGEPGTMQAALDYQDVVQEVRVFLQDRVNAVRVAGIDAGRIVVDPGIGFAKTAEQNVELLRRQQELLFVGRPLLVGWSRKSTLGVITGRAVGDRLAASVAAALAAVQRGASVLRVHDVAATVDALKVWRTAAGGPGTDCWLDAKTHGPGASNPSPRPTMTTRQGPPP
jgi:dihydropteroate synthase